MWSRELSRGNGGFLVFDRGRGKPEAKHVTRTLQRGYSASYGLGLATGMEALPCRVPPSVASGQDHIDDSDTVVPSRYSIQGKSDRTRMEPRLRRHYRPLGRCGNRSGLLRCDLWW
ncbi:hypothetical protein H0G86_007043 [Trichoderma simmonsii]|uniref:Uncharacterized protein n=1 Tax=Trichoderma simmonsii TaxID=1491479 RepID=A0A8G0LCP4_9HYPO|nr:hypothetical protein H0G86_007043 [Trichoderma simmonsii]